MPYISHNGKKASDVLAEARRLLLEVGWTPEVQSVDKEFVLCTDPNAVGLDVMGALFRAGDHKDLVPSPVELLRQETGMTKPRVLTWWNTQQKNVQNVVAVLDRAIARCVALEDEP